MSDRELAGFRPLIGADDDAEDADLSLLVDGDEVGSSADSNESSAAYSAAAAASWTEEAPSSETDSLLDSSARSESSGASSVESSPPRVRAAAAAAAAVPRSEIDALFRMGFPRAVAALALRRTDGTVDGALAWLVEREEGKREHPGDGDDDDAGEGGGGGGGGGSSPAVAGAGALPVAVPSSRGAAAGLAPSPHVLDAAAVTATTTTTTTTLSAVLVTPDEEGGGPGGGGSRSMPLVVATPAPPNVPFRISCWIKVVLALAAVGIVAMAVVVGLMSSRSTDKGESSIGSTQESSSPPQSMWAPSPLPSPAPSTLRYDGAAPNQTLMPTIASAVSPGLKPTLSSTAHPGLEPASQPTQRQTAWPMPQPTEVSLRRTLRPSHGPTTQPTSKMKPATPTTQRPTAWPMSQPAELPLRPTPRPNHGLTMQPTSKSTPHPTSRPSSYPTPKPTPLPTLRPTQYSTPRPTPRPTPNPTPGPTPRPTPNPTPRPTAPQATIDVDTLRDRICSDIPSTCADLSTEGTPQRKALEWAASDPKLEEYPWWRRMQRYALAVVAYSLEGWGSDPDWRDRSGDECAWDWGHGDNDKILCDASGRVTQVGFDSDLVAVGKVPRDVALLSDSLERLWLLGAGFTGSIPVELSMLSNLNLLSLANNKLSGPVPSGLGRLSNLNWLYLVGNDLTGFMPKEVCDLRTGSLWGLTADCEELQCNCCTWCCIDGVRPCKSF